MAVDDDYFDQIEQDVDTLGGVFLEKKQEIPHVGDKVKFRDLQLEITEMDKFRIQQMRVIIPPEIVHKGTPIAK